MSDSDASETPPRPDMSHSLAAVVMPARRAGGRPDPLAPLLDLPGVASAVASTGGAVDRLLAHRVLRRSSAAVSAESALRGARASAALDGASYPLERVRAGGVDDPVLQGALRAGAGLGSLVATWDRAPLQVLAQLHVLAAAGRCAGEELGRPVPGNGTGARLEALASLVAGGTGVPAVVLASVVHGELLTMRPFVAGSGVVARAAARLVLVARGLDPKAVSVPEVGHWELAEEYGARAAGYAAGEPAAVGTWIRHCCQAVELGAREGLAVCEALRRA